MPTTNHTKGERSRPALAGEDVLITRAMLAKRWHCHPVTLIRMAAELPGITLSPRKILFRLNDIRALERERITAARKPGPVAAQS
jgi:hypothetical protein